MSACLLGRLFERSSFPRVFPYCCYAGSSRAFSPWLFKVLGQGRTLSSNPGLISVCLIILWLGEKLFQIGTKGCECCDLQVMHLVQPAHGQ